MSEPILEAPAQKFADATSEPPFSYELGVEGARKALDDIQAAPVEKLDIDEKWVTVPAQVGEVKVRIVKPAAAADALPVILYYPSPMVRRTWRTTGSSPASAGVRRGG